MRPCRQSVVKLSALRGKGSAVVIAVAWAGELEGSHLLHVHHDEAIHLGILLLCARHVSHPFCRAALLDAISSVP